MTSRPRYRVRRSKRTKSDEEDAAHKVQAGYGETGENWRKEVDLHMGERTNQCM